MANSNFVVHNGLTVGPLTIDAATGALTTTGNISVTGGGSFGGLDAAKIQSGASNVAVTTSYVNVSVNGTNVATFSSQSLSLTGFLNTTGNIIANSVEVGSVESSGIIYANSTLASTSTTSGALVVAGGIGVAKDSLFGGNLTISGNLFVNGNVSVFNTNNLSINDSMIYLADDNPADILDIGFVSAFTDAIRYQHTGFVRDATDGIWKLFANVVAEPTTTIDFTGAIYSALQVGNLRVTDTVTAIINAGTNGVGNIGATGATFNTVYAKATTAQYADLAEKYLADAAYAPGTVVDFGGTAEVTAATDDMSVRVAGVVSTQPGYVMNEGLEGESVVTLALTGRVPTKVTGSIRKGDMLVSNGDGRARAEILPRVGSVIGKALENFDGEDGVIEVVVGKH
jgi:hypothetical protein